MSQAIPVTPFEGKNIVEILTKKHNNYENQTRHGCLKFRCLCGRHSRDSRLLSSLFSVPLFPVVIATILTLEAFDPVWIGLEVLPHRHNSKEIITKTTTGTIAAKA